MQIELGACSAYLLRHTVTGQLFICDGASAVKLIADALPGGIPYTVQEMTRTLRWRMLPKKEIRELARVAHYDNNIITIEQFLSIDFWYK